MERVAFERHKDEVPFAQYVERFRSLDPSEASERTGAPFDSGVFRLQLFGTEHEISWPEFSMTPEPHSLPAQTYAMRFLLEGRKAASIGEEGYLTFREMPWGELYIKPFTDRCLKRAAFSLGRDVPAFAAACERLGAASISGADASYEFSVIGGHKIRIMLWSGDDEFPPSAQILFSSSFAESMSAEDRVVSCDIAISMISAEMKRTH